MGGSGLTRVVPRRSVRSIRGPCGLQSANLRFGMPTIGGGPPTTLCNSGLPSLRTSLFHLSQSAKIAVSLSAEHQLHGLGDEIVIGVADDFHSREFADWELSANVNASVNVRSIGFASGDKVFARFEPMGIFAAHETVLP